MASPTASRTVAATVAAIGWAAVLLQAYLSTRASLAQGRTVIDAPVMLLECFTVLTGILCNACALLLAFIALGIALVLVDGAGFRKRRVPA
jgi:hypothetical protein